MQLGSRAKLVIEQSKHAATFHPHMTVDARNMLEAMIDWGCTQLQLFGMSNAALMDKFVERYNQIRFEEAEQMFDTAQYIKLIVGTPGGAKKTPKYKPKTQDDVIAVMCLDLLFDESWRNNNSVNSRHNVGNISHHSELYNWLSRTFCLSDFSRSELGKVAHMASLYDIQKIKEIAQQPSIFGQKGTRNINYLYGAVIKDHDAEKTLSRQNASQVKTSADKLQQLGQMAEEAHTKTPLKPDPDRVARWERERAFIDVWRDLDLE
jgi:hypothetical protein